MSGMDEIKTIQNYRVTLEVQFYGEVRLLTAYYDYHNKKYSLLEASRLVNKHKSRLIQIRLVPLPISFEG